MASLLRFSLRRAVAGGVLGAGLTVSGVAHALRIEEDTKLDFKDVLLRPKRSELSSRAQVELQRTFKFKHSGRAWTGVPLIVANMDTVGTFEILASCPGVGAICLDVANGYSEAFVATVKAVRGRYPTHTIIAGNVVTNEMTEDLIINGADVVKVGIGPGSVCTTRKQTGVGYPQLSAVIECADAAHGMGGHIVADGGITCPGDAAKAFGGGTDFVMCGGMFAGTDEAAGKVVERDGHKFKQFYGMSSSTAMKKHAGGVANYRASEGKTVEVAYKGPVDAVLLDFFGGLRSACTYIGAKTLEEMPRRTTFVRVTQQLNQVFGSHDLSKK